MTVLSSHPVPIPANNNDSESLPDYAGEMDAFHRAFERELKILVESLPIRPGMRILDVGCGDGFYLKLLAEHPARPAAVVGVDSNAEYLALAREKQSQGKRACPIEVLSGSLAELPVGRGEFDVVWCAQSLYSFPEPVEALRQMSKAVVPGGLVIVLENDTLHQVFLPWPMHLEIALRAAELLSFAEESRQPGKFYIGRCLPRVFAAAGLQPLGFKTQSIDRAAPLDNELLTFVQTYLERLADRVRGRLDRSLLERFARLICPKGPDWLLAQPQFTMTWLNCLAWGRRPNDGSS